MQANRLNLQNFRNYTEQSLEFGSGVNILCGDNAQGKTKVLEAIYLFSMGKANRARRDTELIYHGRESAALTLDFVDGDRESTAQIELYHNRRKSIRVNDIPIRKNSELVGRFRVVYFGPEYLSLVKEGPKQRRRNLDILISQLRPSYFSALSDYKKLLDSKNALLKMERPNMAMLEILNDKMSSVAAEMIVCRAAYLDKIGRTAGAIQHEISDGREKLSMRYLSCIGSADGLTQAEVKEKLFARLCEVSGRELDSRESVIGPHREDIDYLINEQSAKAFASQGQQKTIVLVQKLAEVELMQEETGDYPVLLLDDIMSELDQKRRSFVLRHIRKTQMFVTCTDLDGLTVDESTCLFRVENGTARREGGV